VSTVAPEDGLFSDLESRFIALAGRSFYLRIRVCPTLAWNPASTKDRIAFVLFVTHWR